MSSSIVAAASTAISAAASATSSAAAGIHGGHESRPPVYKAIGVSLAIASGVFIGVSFVLKKKGLLQSNLNDEKEAGEGYGYLKNAWWWSGMILMIVGEICNFCAYAFVEAILVTPLGALSVVITAILSSIFLKERLSFIGKIGCFMCIVGSIVIVINAPEQSSVSTIQDMKGFILSPGFLCYAGIVILACVGIVVWIAPKYGNKSMMVYISVCSLIGGLSVVATQGLGAAVVSQASGIPQFNQWFLYVLFVFVIITLVVEIIYLNKALNIYNAALVTPTYYVFFTSSTIVTSSILFRGFKGTPSSITTVVMGFLQICAGVVLLQLSKSAKNVPDTEIFRGDLDQVRTVAEQEEPESEPKADAIRGTAAIIRRISVARQKAEVDEAKRVREDRMQDLQSRPLGDQQYEWDGVHRRITWGGDLDNSGARRRNTTSGSHPPLGMTRMPDLEEGIETTVVAGTLRRRSMSVDEGMRRQIYGSGLDEEDFEPPHTFFGRMKSIFVSRPSSKASFREGIQGGPDVVAVSASSHRDLRDANRPLGSTDHSAPLPMSILPASSVTGRRSFDFERASSTPQVNILRPTQGFSCIDFAAPQPDHRMRKVSGGTDYTEVPVDTSMNTSLYATPMGMTPRIASPAFVPPISANSQSSYEGGLRPTSAASGSGSKRQFSFQSVFGRHSHSRSRSSSSRHDANVQGSDGASDLSSRLGIGHKKNSSLETKPTEEEMLGLVQGDSREILRKLPVYDSDDDSEKGGKNTIRAVETEVESAEMKWKESGGGGATFGKGKRTK